MRGGLRVRGLKGWRRCELIEVCGLSSTAIRMIASLLSLETCWKELDSSLMTNFGVIIAAGRACTES